MLKTSAELQHAVNYLGLRELAIMAHDVVNECASVAQLAEHIAERIVAFASHESVG